MLQNIFASLFFLIACSGYCQNIKGIVLDSISGNGIEYATVYSKNNPQKGGYSKENGFFSIRCSPSDTICISAIGYHSLFFVPKPNDTVVHYRLAREVIVLPELVVKSKKPDPNAEKLSLGFHKQKKEFFAVGVLGGKKMVFIKPIEKAGDYAISDLLFSITKPKVFAIEETQRKEYKKGLVRILLYQIDSTSNELFFKSLLPEELVCEVAKKNYLLKVDVRKYNILFPSTGLYMGLEWLGEKDSDSTVINHNLSPWIGGSNSTDFKVLESLFGKKFYDPYSDKTQEIPFKFVFNFGLEVIKVD
jgi:hypothetical protein